MLSTVKDGFLEETDNFGEEQGFAFAVGIFNEEMDMPPLDPSIATLKIKSMTWGFTANEEYIYEEEYLDLHLCSEEELGLGEGKAKFMPIKDSSTEELEMMAGKLYCLAEADAYIYGNY